MCLQFNRISGAFSNKEYRYWWNPLDGIASPSQGFSSIMLQVPVYKL